MHALKKRSFAHSVVATVAAAGSLALLLCAAQAQDKTSGTSTYVMKISTPTINDVPDTYARNLGAALERDSAGRIKVEVYPASQLGSIPRQIEGTQFGAIQCEVVPPEFLVGLDQRFEVLAAPGLVSSLPQGQNVAEDPEVRKLMLGLGSEKGLHGAALFIASPTCRRPSACRMVRDEGWIDSSTRLIDPPRAAAALASSFPPAHRGSTKRATREARHS